MQIDRSDLVDKLVDAHMARRARSAPDVPDAADNDLNKAAGNGNLPGSPAASLDSASRMERATAYRATVDAAYRQYTADHGDMRTGNRTNDYSVVTQPVTGEVPRGGAETVSVLVLNSADDLGYPAPQIPADVVQTGARGPASGREFDPEGAGGPIRQLDAGKEPITDEGVQEVMAHLQRFTGGGSLQAPEQGMLDRLKSIAAGDMEPTSYDLNFYTHELDEAGRYAQLGFGPGSGVDLGNSEMYDVWNDVHTATLEDYRISDADLFYPGLAP